MLKQKRNKLYKFLKNKADWLRKETLKIHKVSAETRLASSLSAVEIFTVLYYGNILKFDAKNTDWPGRDRFIISKGHGAVSLYPALADLGFFGRDELMRVCKEGSFLGGIPDPVVPGFETINGSLGHGLGVACGMCVALKLRKRKEKVLVLIGDGEMNEGSVWEAIMFAGQHKLDNLVLIIDNNKICMLDYCRNVIDLDPLEGKFLSFKWNTKSVDGHSVTRLHAALNSLKKYRGKKPTVLIANTIKGKGVSILENDSLNHVKSLKAEEVDAVISRLP
jgi:transketolase